MLINLDGKSISELKELLEVIKTSEAPYEIKKRNIDNINKVLRLGDYEEILKDIEDGQADIDDINN